MNFFVGYWARAPGLQMTGYLYGRDSEPILDFPGWVRLAESNLCVFFDHERNLSDVLLCIGNARCSCCLVCLQIIREW